MSNPVLVEILRGGVVESRHRGAVAVCDADGKSVLALGDTARPVFPRSAIKAFQALPLIESGAAERYGLTEAEIALALASHGGEPTHVATAAAMLAKCGRDASALECGVHVPSFRGAADALAKAGEKPSALHNNCSGKHAGFICVSCHAGRDPFGYVTASHATQREVMGAVSDMTGAPLADDLTGVDGCSIPTQAAPLAALATGFARFGTGAHLPPERAKAAARLTSAAAAHPYMVAGTGRFCTEVMEALRARAFVKTGAEGVFCAAFPGLGLGVALKSDDGATRAAELIMASVIERFLELSEEERRALDPHLRPVLKNWNGIEVGAMQAAGPLASGSGG
jgi:L-asparaginase II